MFLKRFNIKITITIKGIDSFSPDKNVRLTTYIAKCAENEILMYFRADKKNSKILVFMMVLVMIKMVMKLQYWMF